MGSSIQEKKQMTVPKRQSKSLQFPIRKFQSLSTCFQEINTCLDIKENKGHGRTRWVMWRLKILHDRVEWRSRYIGPPPAPVSYVLACALIFVGPSCKQQCCLVHCYSVCRAYTLPETYQKFGALWIECFLILITVLSWLGCISLASEVCGHNPEGPQTRVLWPLDTEVEQPLKRLTGALFKEETWVVLIHCKAICIGMLLEWTSGRHIN